ncbi:hypothetical protein H4582DRAFT_336848 [Lactarius indigo]|nr:hypothetical protein H4582DRAFT_336848 [Lactarius indigo]
MSAGAIPLRSASGATSTPARESHNGPKDRVIKKRPQRSLARDQSHTSIHVLSDGVLLDIFDFCRTERGGGVFRKHTNLEWQLVRVCRRWRYLILASPSRLDLKLLCKHGTPVRKALDCWPAFPIIIEYDNVSQKDEDNIIAALGGHPDRVRRIRLFVEKSSWEKIRTSMRKPFPSLTHLCLETKDRDPEQVVSLPRKFLGDSTPRLEEVYLRGISFSAPSLPTYLLSASNLINLQILEIPHTNFISPDVMVTGLASLTRLETLAIEFRHPLPRAERRLSPPAIPIVRFPVLSSFKFRGFCDYLEGLVAQIDAPRVSCCNIWYFSQPMYQVPQFSRFLGRTEYFKPPWLSRAQIEFVERWMGIELDVGDNDEARGERGVPCDPGVPGVPHLNIRLISEGMAREALHSIQVLHQLSSSLANVVDLTICGPADGPLFPKYANGLFFRRADVRRSPAHFAAVRPVGRCSMANCCSPDRRRVGRTA